MKKLAFCSLFVACFFSASNAATPQQRRGQATANNAAPATSNNTTAARAATSARRLTGARSATTTSAPTTAARAAVSTRTSVPRAATSAPSPTISARAGATKKVISSGTSVAAATKNTVVSEACQQKYDGCMDSFCMIDNASGGRCLCSNKNSELDEILAQIEKLDQQSYQMATVGVERIEMGADAEAAIANANAVAQSLTQTSEEKKTNRRSLDLSLWDNSNIFEEDEDIFASAAQSLIDGKTGDALHATADELCVAQIPECQNEMSMLRMMYSQRIKSDCTAYENSLKQQKNASQNKLATAEKALRDAALEQLRTSNKYDLGQCTVEFKKCMSTTGGCGDDFKGCVGIAAAENAKTSYGTSSNQKMVEIVGSHTKISIAASSYDTLESKKPLCDSIMNSCVAVRDQVWNTFLREIAPQIKTAELLAESDLRTSCISNISACFQKACKDTMDPNDPDGSYDMCLSRPETVKSLCKVQIEPCVNAEPLILDFVYARLAAMRVDSCTSEVKECLTADDKCGDDYTQCIGLDTDTIVRMCPADKLVGCQKVYGDTDIRGDAVYDELANMVQGIMLSIDNNMMTECQNAANEAMIAVCGDTENCNGLAVDDNVGARSLEYKICETQNGVLTSRCYTNTTQIPDSSLGRTNNGTQGESKHFEAKIDGQIAWELLDFDENGLLNIDQAISKYNTNMSQAEKDKVKSELAVVTNSINMAVQAIESDAKVNFCMTGREVQGMRKNGEDRRSTLGEKGAGRFTNLTTQMRTIIAAAAIAAAKENYYKKYDDISTNIAKDMSSLAERIAKNADENELDARREIARQACVNYAQASAIGVGGTVFEHGTQRELVGSASVNTRSYKETTTSTFNWETLICHRCIRKQGCAKMKGKNCRTWGEESESCKDIPF